MGLFDFDKAEDREKRLSTLIKLSQDINKATEEQERAVAAIEAGTQSAVEWLSISTAGIVGTHQLLMNALIAGDENGYSQILKDRQDIVGLVLEIPMDGPDGTQVTLRRLTKEIFGMFSDPVRAFKQIKAVVPPAAFGNKNPEDFIVRRPRESVLVSEGSVWSKVAGHQREEEFRRIQALETTLKLTEISHPRERAEAETRRAEALEAAIKEMQAVGLHHFRLREAAAGGNAAVILSALAELEKLDLTAKVISMPFYSAEGDACGITAIALEGVKDGNEKARIYNRFLKLGAPPQRDKVIAHSFAAENRMAPGPLKNLMAELYNEKGAEEFEKTILAPYDNGASLIERSLGDEALQRALLSPVQEPVARAGLMFKAASVATSERAAVALREQATALAGGDEWLRLSTREAARLSGISRASASETGGFEYVTRGHARIAGAFNAAAGAGAIEHISRHPDFIRVSDKEVLNVSHVIGAEIRDEGAGRILQYSVRGGTYTVPCSDENAAVLDRLGSRAGWFRMGNVVLNTALIDNMWIDTKGAEPWEWSKGDLGFLAAGTKYSSPITRSEARKLFTFAHAQGNFKTIDDNSDPEVLLGKDLVNISTIGALWLEPDHAQAGKGRVYFSTGLTEGKTGSTVSLSVAPRIFKKIAGFPGYAAVGKVGVVKMSLADAMNHSSAQPDILNVFLAGHQIALTGDKKTLSDLTALQKRQEKTGESAGKIKNASPEFIEDEPGSVIRPARIGYAFYDRSRARLDFDLSGQAHGTLIKNESAAAAVLSHLESAHGFFPREDGTLMNPAAIDAVWHDDDAFHWVVAGSVWSSTSVGAAEAEAIVERVIKAPAPGS